MPYIEKDMDGMIWNRWTRHGKT